MKDGIIKASPIKGITISAMVIMERHKKYLRIFSTERAVASIFASSSDSFFNISVSIFFRIKF